MLRSSLCDYSDAYIFVSGTITVGALAAGGRNNNIQVVFKNCAPFTSCIYEINITQIDNAKDIDVVMPLYNLLIEYFDNYSKTSECLSQYYRDEPALAADDALADFPGNSASFKYKQKITGSTGNYGTKDVEIMVPLKYLSNFWISLEMPLINCEINLILTWSVNCVISSAAANQTTTFSITDTKFYVPVVTLSTEDNEKLLQQLKSGFKRTINWNKYHSKTKTLNDPKPYLDFLFDPSFQGVNRLFVLPFNDLDDRTGHSRYYLPNAKVKDYNVTIDGKNLFDQPVKSYIRTYENIRKITTGQGDDYTTGCLLDYNFFKKNYKMIAIDLSKQQSLHADPKAIQQINFTGNLDGNNNRLLLFIIEDSERNHFRFSKGTVKVLQFYFVLI